MAVGTDSDYDLEEVDPDDLDPDPSSDEWLDYMVERIWAFIVDFADVEGFPFPYQEQIGKALVRSIIAGDGEILTFLLSRQAGKSEVVANVIAGLMVLLPPLAKMFPDRLGKFAKGFWVGCFAPVEEQIRVIYGRVVDRLTSPHAVEVMSDPDIDDEVQGNKSRELFLKRSGSLVRMTTANPRAKIEGKTYHLVVIDEAQGLEEFVYWKSIKPMTDFYFGTTVLVGTPYVTKDIFYKQIQSNRRRALERGGRKTHFEFPWTECAKYNRNYKRSVMATAAEIGEDSDEFRMNYRLEWLLERGMFVSDEQMSELGDPTMQIVPQWWKSPVLVGIDPARKLDSTVVTVVWVDWDRPDEYGYFHHRILNWLEMHGEAWEEQYFRITEFLMQRYNVLAVGVDAQGVGDAMADRLQTLMPNVQVVPMMSSPKDQSERWTHLTALIQRRMLFWPAHPKVRRTKMWQRFEQQMKDLEKEYRQGYLLAGAAEGGNAHDDFPDSLALACMLSKDFIVPESDQTSAPWW